MYECLHPNKAEVQPLPPYTSFDNHGQESMARCETWDASIWPLHLRSNRNGCQIPEVSASRPPESAIMAAILKNAHGLAPSAPVILILLLPRGSRRKLCQSLEYRCCSFVFSRGPVSDQGKGRGRVTRHSSVLSLDVDDDSLSFEYSPTLILGTSVSFTKHILSLFSVTGSIVDRILSGSCQVA